MKNLIYILILFCALSKAQPFTYYGSVLGANEQGLANIPVSLYGQCADFDAINAIAAKYNKLKGEQDDFLPIAEIDSAEYRGTHHILLSIINLLILSSLSLPLILVLNHF